NSTVPHRAWSMSATSCSTHCSTCAEPDHNFAQKRKTTGIQTMRISSNLFFQTGLNSINAQQSDLVHLYKQVGSGKRMVTPSDDPLASAQAINVSQTLAMGERYAANRKVANQNLGMQDDVLSSVTLQLQDVKTRLV